MFDWNDLKYLLAVGRDGSTLAAGRTLGVDQSTVQRRLGGLERRLGVLLTSRDVRGYHLTDSGRSLLVAAEQVERAVQAFEQRVAELRDVAAGVVRVTCPEPLALRLARSTLLERFHARHPDVRVEFVLSDRYLDLTHGDADIALRSGDTDDGELIGRRIGDSLWAIYVGRRCLACPLHANSIDELAEHDWIGFDDSMANHRASVWLRSVLPAARVVVRNSSVLGAIDSAKAGLGLAALPTAVADADRDLVRVLGPIAELTRIWRVLTTAELRKQARVAAFFDYMVAETDALRPILTG